MKPIYSDILKELRRDRKLTQKDMGDLMGISQTTYCDYEIAGGMQWSVSNRNGGSHMMLDNKTEQK